MLRAHRNSDGHFLDTETVALGSILQHFRIKYERYNMGLHLSIEAIPTFPLCRYFGIPSWPTDKVGKTRLISVGRPAAGAAVFFCSRPSHFIEPTCTQTDGLTCWHGVPTGGLAASLVWKRLSASWITQFFAGNISSTLHEAACRQQWPVKPTYIHDASRRVEIIWRRCGCEVRPLLMLVASRGRS